MIIKCTNNNYSRAHLSNELEKYLLEIYPNGLDNVLLLDLDKIYVCYAVVFSPITEWFFITDEAGARYPSWYSSILFDILNNSVSRYWSIGNFVDFKGSDFPLLAFDAWANNPYFHGQLFEGDMDTISTFEFHKKLMDVEFPKPDIIDEAEALGEPCWVFDSETEESWETNPLDALTRIPGTKKLLNNPYYNNLFHASKST